MSSLPKSLESLKSIGKIILQSRPTSIRRTAEGDTIAILGNGPSLRGTIDHDLDKLTGVPLLAVNFAANTPEFQQLKPRYYVLMDPHFFLSFDDRNVALLMQNLAAVTWKMTLVIPRARRSQLPREVKGNPNIEILTFNAVGIEGYRALENCAYRHRLGMPRPRNVLIPAIMIAIWLGYSNIYIYGADHTWIKTLTVEDDNRVVSIQEHFYREEDHEIERIKKEYVNHRLDSVLESLVIALRSYHSIERYARAHGIHIYNATPGSMIDAFERRTL